MTILNLSTYLIASEAPIKNGENLEVKDSKSWFTMSTKFNTVKQAYKGNKSKILSKLFDLYN